MQSLKTAIGLMSGTSMDGIDAALIRSDGEISLKVVTHASFDYPPDFRRQLKQALDVAQTIKKRQKRPGSLASLERELTSYHAQIVQRLLAEQNMQPQQVDLIGFHGQTILHRPDKALTVQLGLGTELARQTGIDVIYDMRANDMRHGGQGAPLTPAYHAALAAQLPDKSAFPCCFVNIGGIANLTFIQGSDIALANAIMAFDCGPGNCLIDQWMESRAGLNFDEGGQAGLCGRVHERVLESYWQHDAFMRLQPSSFDWRDFLPLRDEQLSLEDGAATLAALSARAIFHSFRFLPAMPESLIVSGGGVKNACLMRALTNLAEEKNIKVLMAQDCGWQSDFIEAEAWAYLAIRASQNLPLSFPATTGVKFPVTGGVRATAS